MIYDFGRTEEEKLAVNGQSVETGALLPCAGLPHLFGPLLCRDAPGEVRKETMSRIAALFAAFMLVVAGVFAVGVGTAGAAAPCVGRWDVGVGGFVATGGQDSAYIGNVNQRVGYNSYDTQGGVNELNRLVREHRAQCSGDWIQMTGHSGGAAVVHAWIEQNGNIGRIGAVLLGDPKRAAGPGGPGFAQTDFPFNVLPTLAGANANFRGVPTLTVCNGGDHICNSQAGWEGYLFFGAHNYNYNAKSYAQGGSGVIFR